ncbi:MAG: M48 family metallopeptidase [Dysgonamonadaceae bacterium]|jgi:heat shock protein HtpX|nr:M48 family metallopeptidase [Dysgonamonadaceae bacterium]
MQYVGIQTQKSRNNLRSLLLLFLFPVLVLALTLLFLYLLRRIETPSFGYAPGEEYIPPSVMSSFAEVAPWVLGIVLVWFLIAYFANTHIIVRATHSKPLERKNNGRVYNLVENLCMSQGMPMPKINIIADRSLNAFASGINRRTYTVTLTEGIINRLDDRELESVIAHELSHIRNHDVRLLITSIVFVGIFAMLAELSFRMLLYAPRNRDKKGGGGGVIVVFLLAIAVGLLGYFFSSLMRFAISRKREYLADAGAAEMTKNPAALASALRKISADPGLEAVTRNDVAQLFIEHPRAKARGKSLFGSLFATHPPIEKRIELLEQF